VQLAKVFPEGNYYQRSLREVCSVSVPLQGGRLEAMRSVPPGGSGQYRQTSIANRQSAIKRPTRYRVVVLTSSLSVEGQPGYRTFWLVWIVVGKTAGI
jgi:hypothetical protein